MVQEVERVVVAYCNKVWKTRKSPNKVIYRKVNEFPLA
jgi:hypothetical protein